MTKQITEIFRKSTTRVKCMAFHPTNSVLITGNHCGTVYIWNILYQQVIAVLREHSGSVRTIKMHPSGEIFATAGNDKTIRIWNYKDKQVACVLKDHSDYIRSIDFHPTKPWLVSASDDCTIKIWNIYTGEMLCSSSGHTHYVMSVLFLDSTHILTASLDHSIGLWNCANLFEKKKFMVPDVVLSQTIDAHDRGVNALSLCDGYVMSGSDDKIVKIWKYKNETLEIEKELYNHDRNITTVFTDGTAFYSGSEDNIMAVYSEGKTKKIDVGTRVWAINGKDEYIAVGTDDGLVVYTTAIQPVFCCDSNEIYYTQGKMVKKYNMKRSHDYGKIKEDARSIFLAKDNFYVIYDECYEIYNDGRRIGGDVGSIAFLGADKYTLKEDKIYKNEEVFRPGIAGRLQAAGDMLFVLDNKTFSVISDGQEISMTFNFPIKSVQTNGNTIALIGTNKILLLDKSLNIKNTINELVSITGGLFNEDIFIYTTMKQIKFFYEDIGILQSIDSFVTPVMMQDEYLLVISQQKGVEKILLNFSEIRFRRAVLNDKNILSTIEEEQLPGLSPLEYLIKKEKGGIALPFIKDDEKRFQLFMCDQNYEEALKLCRNNRMIEELALNSLKNGRYDIAETCFKKIQDHNSLFYLYLCTKQFEKLKEPEGAEIENMAKIILEDRSVISTFREEDEMQQESSASIEIKNKVGEKKKVNKEPIKPKKEISESEKETKTDEDLIEIKKQITKGLNDIKLSENKEEMAVKKEVKAGIVEVSNESDEKSSESEEKERIDRSPEQLTKEPIKQVTEVNNSTESDSEAALNDSDHMSQIFDASEIEIPEELVDEDPQELYQSALNLTTQGKFSKANEVFRNCISLFAQKMRSKDDFSKMRKRIGNYLLGLHIEKCRRSIEDPAKSIQMSLFFAGLDLEPIHTLLVKNLAITTCFKNGNLKTAYEIAEQYPDCKNAKKILAGEKGEDKYSFDTGYLCYDTTNPEKECKECAMCGVKSKGGDNCGACIIGVLH